mgnify:CR=1 FL=1
MRLFTGFIFSLLCGVAMTASASAASLVIGSSTEPTAIDPHFARNGNNQQIAVHIFDRLADQDENLQIRPGLAVSWKSLEGVVNIYDETPARALALARGADSPDAQAVFLSGVGMPTVDVLEAAEHALGKPAMSSASAMMWHALCVAGVTTPVEGFGRLLSGAR